MHKWDEISKSQGRTLTKNYKEQYLGPLSCSSRIGPFEWGWKRCREIIFIHLYHSIIFISQPCLEDTMADETAPVSTLPSSQFCGDLDASPSPGKGRAYLQVHAKFWYPTNYHWGRKHRSENMGMSQQTRRRQREIIQNRNMGHSVMRIFSTNRKRSSRPCGKQKKKYDINVCGYICIWS